MILGCFVVRHHYEFASFTVFKKLETGANQYSLTFAPSSAPVKGGKKPHSSLKTRWSIHGGELTGLDSYEVSCLNYWLVFYVFLSFSAEFSMEELNVWNVEKLRKYLRNRGNAVANDTRKPDLFLKVYHASRLH